MPDSTTEFIERINVLDRCGFGVKVMEWANHALPIPQSLEEAEQQLTGIVEFPMPSYITGLSFIETTKDIWTIKLPPPEMLADTRKRINMGLAYTLPSFYVDRVNGSLPDNHRLFECRVGDYTCSLCT